MERERINSFGNKKITEFFFGVYLVMLTWGILFKLKLNFSDLPKVHQIVIKPHCLNIASLKTISDLTKNDVTLNIMAFVPFGMYMGAVKDNLHTVKCILIMCVTSVIYEACQYAFSIGCCDINDVINNTLGGIVGMLIYMIASKILKKYTNIVFNAGAGGATVLVFIYLCVRAVV